jgi:hypothetical protein
MREKPNKFKLFRVPRIQNLFCLARQEVRRSKSYEKTSAKQKNKFVSLRPNNVGVEKNSGQNFENNGQNFKNNGHYFF